MVLLVSKERSFAFISSIFFSFSLEKKSPTKSKKSLKTIQIDRKLGR